MDLIVFYAVTLLLGGLAASLIIANIRLANQIKHIVNRMLAMEEYQDALTRATMRHPAFNVDKFVHNIGGEKDSKPHTEENS